MRDTLLIDDAESDESIAYEGLYSISSYGVDYPVDAVVSRLDRDIFYIPHFQRSYVWSINQASRFVESLLLGLPVPGFFLFKESDTGRHLVVDGQQRLRTLTYFIKGTIGNKVFRLTNLKSPWNGLAFDDLGSADRNRLMDAALHMTVFVQDYPDAGRNSVYEVFERINTGGTKLSSQEIRACIFHGEFQQMLERWNELPVWRSIYGKPSPRLKDQELLLRFVAMFGIWRSYARPLKQFLNDYMELNRHISSDKARILDDVVYNTLEVVSEALGDKPFRPERGLNTAVFDSVMVGVATRVRMGPHITPAEVRRGYDWLLRDESYQSSYKRATADERNVHTRMELAIGTFSA